MFYKQFNGKPVGYLITEENMRQILFELDFDKGIPPKLLEDKGYAYVEAVEPPAHTVSQRVEEIDCIRLENGFWRQQWQVIDLPSEEQTALYNEKLAEVTAHKNNLLAIYAQQLADPNESEDQRVIIQQAIDATNAVDLSDPFNVNWPIIY